MQNRLSSECSPYLLQHAQNPVAWQAWNAEGLALARELDRPIFLSIGYSTCYWCHVMEQDSFERTDVAEILNAHFVPIKLDREERPDIDDRYMQAVVALSGHGGWPLSVFLTPDLKVFWGGTFFYRAQFLGVLEQISKAWRTRRVDVLQAAEQLTELSLERYPAGVAQSLEWRAARTQVLEVLKQNWDFKWGGSPGAPKFPPAATLRYLLAEFARAPKVEIRSLLVSCLDGMARGGIFDHLGGGFSRYSVDAEWTVPHFEKMLYDSAQLSAIYAEAAAVLERPDYAEIARSCYEFIERELFDASLGYFTALDAGEVDREGEYYVWRYEELREILSSTEFAEMASVFNLAPEGNFEGQIVLRMAAEIPLAARQQSARVRQLLLEVRQKRHRPRLDNKVLTGLNGLTLSSLCTGYRSSGEPSLRDRAKASLKMLLGRVCGAKGLIRCGSGTSTIPALAEDYAYLIAACLDVFEISSEPEFLKKAEEIQKEFDARFLSAEGYYLDTCAPELRPKAAAVFDHVLPSPQAVALENLQRLFAILAQPEWHEKAEKLAGWLSQALGSRGISAMRALETLVPDLAPRYVFLSAAAGSEWLEILKSYPRVHRVVLTPELRGIPALATKQVEREACAWLCGAEGCLPPLRTPGALQKALNESVLDITQGRQ